MGLVRAIGARVFLQDLKRCVLKSEMSDLRAWLLVGEWLGVDGSDTHDCDYSEKND